MAHLVSDLSDARHSVVVRLGDLNGIPPLVDHVAIHIRLQRLGHDAHTCWADGVLVLAAAVTASLPRGDRRRHPPAARRAVDQTDQRVHTGLAKFSRRRLGSSRSPTNRSWVARSMIAGHARV